MAESSFSVPLRGFRGSCVTTGTGFGTARDTMLAHLRRLGAAVTEHEARGMSAVGLALDGPGTRFSASLTGRARPATPFAEHVAQADCGIMAVHGRSEADPRPLGVDHVSVLSGIAAVQGTLAVVLGRLRGLPVERVALTAERVALLAVGQYLAAATTAEEPETGGAPSSGRPPFVCADGTAFEIEAFDADTWQRFWSALGVADRTIGRAWRPFLLRYERASLSLPRELHDAVGLLRVDEVRAVAGRTGMHLCPVRTVAQRLADPDAGATPWDLTAGPSAHVPARPVSGALPLAGIHVVESTRRVQGPLATRLLYLLGATVTRIEPPGGDPLRGMPPLAGDCSAKFRAVNDGKRTVEIDFRTPAGRDEVRELAREADVFLHNWAPGKAAELGLDAATLHAVRPSLIYATASGWGSALGATPPAGTDYTVQAYSGVADAVRDPGGPARPTLMITVDVVGGFLSAEGVLAALVGRERSGRGGTVETSLLAAADCLLAERLRRGSASEHPPVDGVFPTGDEPIAVVADHRTTGALAGVLGLPADALDRADDLPTAITKALAGKPAAEWVRRLRSAGVPSAVVRRDLASLATGRHLGRLTGQGCAISPSCWDFSPAGREDGGRTR